jgi:thiol-disulfide isomerase/thioredoxin
VNPTSSIERSDAVERRLADIRGKSKFDVATAERQPSAAALPGVARRSDLPVLGDAPDFTGNDRWFNTNDRALHLSDLRGRVVLVDFWTYTCINCVRTLPQLRAWNERYRGRGLTIVGVHTPEFAFEHDAGNVADAIAQNRITYPVAQDNEYGTWNAYGNQFWPASYLIDARGKVRYTHFGEGGEVKTEAAIRSLLRETRGGALGRLAGEHAEVPSADLATPETYLGTDRAERFLPGNPTAGTRTYPGYRRPLPLSHLALGGTWNATGETATAVRNASLRLRFQARRVYLVLGAEEGMSRPVDVLLDGRRVRAGTAGSDVRSGRLDVRRQRLYNLVSLPRVERRTLTLRFSPGVSGYAFTFG